MADSKWKVTYDHYGSNREVPLYTKSHNVHAKSSEEAISTIKKLVGGRNHKAELVEHLALDESNMITYAVKHDGVPKDHELAGRFGNSKDITNHLTKYQSSANDRAEYLKKQGFLNVRVIEKKLRSPIGENAIYKYHEHDEDGRHAFVTSSTDPARTSKTMQDHAARTGKKIRVSLNGELLGHITKNGFSKINEDAEQLDELSNDSYYGALKARALDYEARKNKIKNGNSSPTVGDLIDLDTSHQKLNKNIKRTIKNKGIVQAAVNAVHYMAKRPKATEKDIRKNTLWHNSGVREEVELEESKMSELHADIGDHMDKHINNYKRIGGAEALMGHADTAAKNIAKMHNIKDTHAKKFVSDYIDSKLNEGVKSVNEAISSAVSLKMLSKQLTDAGFQHTHSALAGKHSGQYYSHPKTKQKKVIRWGKIIDLDEALAPFSDEHLKKLHAEYSKIKSVDPSQPTYGKMTKMLDSLPQSHLKQLHAAGIPWLGKLAKNRIKEDVDLNEGVSGVSEISKGYYEHANGKRPSGKSYGWLFSTVHPAKHSWDKHKEQTYQHSGEATFSDAAKAAVKHFKDKGHVGDIHVLS